MASYHFVVLTNPVPGRDDEFNHWYSETHLGDVLAVPGFVAAQRFRIADPDAQESHKYLAIYEIETSDLAKTMKLLNAAAGTPAMLISDAMDAASVSAIIYEPITSRVVAKGR